MGMIEAYFDMKDEETHESYVGQLSENTMSDSLKKKLNLALEDTHTKQIFSTPTERTKEAASRIMNSTWFVGSTPPSRALF